MSTTASAGPGLDRLLVDARRGKFDVVLVWSFGRLARSAFRSARYGRERRPGKSKPPRSARLLTHLCRRRGRTWLRAVSASNWGTDGSAGIRECHKLFDSANIV